MWYTVVRIQYKFIALLNLLDRNIFFYKSDRTLHEEKSVEFVNNSEVLVIYGPW
jgi:hypothetical protein